MPVDAVLLAGRKNEGALKDVSPETWEAMVEIGGRPMAAWVADAALKADGVSRLAIIGPKDLQGHLAKGNVLWVEPGESMLENLTRGVEALGSDKKVLVLTSDIPLLRSSMVEEFLEETTPLDADFCYPIVPKTAVESRFGKSARTYVTLREGTFTGGNIVLLNPGVVKRLAKEAGEFIALRKEPVKLVRRLGLGFLIRFFLLRPGVKEVERHFSRLFGIDARAITVPHPEIGIDVDKPQDVLFCQEILAAT